MPNKEKLRYKFDQLMSLGTFAPLMLLIAFAIVSVSFLALLIYFSESNAWGFGESYYKTVLRLLDPGVVADDDPSHISTVFLFVATLLGLFLVSVLIALVNSGVMRKLTELRKGRSRVVEEGHTVVLGWSFQIFPILEELCIANANQKSPVIVVMADQDTSYMQDQINLHVEQKHGTKIVCRSGNPIDVHDLAIANLDNSKSIIITAPESDDPDSEVIKTILAITNNPNRLPKSQKKYHHLAEIRDPRNISIAHIAGQNEVDLVVFDYLVSRITAQTCRQPGLSVVFTELLDFSGDEIYFQDEPKLYGKSFAEAIFAYDTSTVIGIRKANGTKLITPPFDTIIREGDYIIAISEDDDTVKLSGLKNFGVDNSAILSKQFETKQAIENILVIGWNRRAQLIINELDKYLAKGSSIDVLSSSSDTEAEVKQYCSGLVAAETKVFFGDTANRTVLEKVTEKNYDHIIVLSQEERFGIQSSDAKTLSTLLHLRDISNKKNISFSIVSEMLDDRNRELAEITDTDDFIVSVKLDSLMLTQVSENRELKEILEMLFSAGGPTIYIKPVEDYVKSNMPVNFYTVIESARQKGEVAIGYKLGNPDKVIKSEHMLAHGIVVNPVKKHEVFFNLDDQIIVLGKDNARE
ncbi:MAG: lipoprotein [Candidatus Kapaibacteriales bacterium]